MNRFFVLLTTAFIIALYPATASTETEVIVSTPDQTVVLVNGGNLIACYRVSTSKFDNGDSAGSYRTPLGTLFVSGRFGDRLPVGTAIKNRMPSGEIIAVDAPKRDAIVSRVIWLGRMEQQNAAAHDRCIYIHGTPEERNIGKAASFGCIRMRSRDIIALYDRVHIGMRVTVSKKLLEELVSCEKPTLFSRAD